MRQGGKAGPPGACRRKVQDRDAGTRNDQRENTTRRHEGDAPMKEARTHQGRAEHAREPAGYGAVSL